MIENVYNKGESTGHQVMQALRRLALPEGQPVRQFLVSKLVEYHETLKCAKTVEDVYRLQGRIAAVEEILETIASTRQQN